MHAMLDGLPARCGNAGREFAAEEPLHDPQGWLRSPYIERGRGEVLDAVPFE